MLIKYLLISAIFDPKVEDFLRSFGVCKFDGGCAIELNVVGVEALSSFKHLPWNIENFHSQSSRLCDTIVLRWIANFSAIAHGDWVFSRL